MQVCIFCGAGFAACRCLQVSSNVWRRKFIPVMSTGPVNLPPLRQFLLLEALSFIKAASRISGVLRIAMIGSLTTAKAEPKDIDLMLTVDDGLDLERLAATGRRLKGRAQGRNSGADIFLLNARGEYIGRTCQWRECAPGVRMSCRADSCGRRPYLYDDLRVLTLTELVVSHPPLQLWPEIVIQDGLPNDVLAWVAYVKQSLYGTVRSNC